MTGTFPTGESASRISLRAITWRMSKDLRDAPHFTVRQLSFFELSQPVVVIFFQKNLFDRLFQFAAVFPPTFDAGETRIF